MRKAPPERLELCRIRHGEYASETGEMHGAFLIVGPFGRDLAVISSGDDSETRWQHVSVSTRGRCPNWPEMCFIKDLFWDEDEVVMQLHPAKKDYVNHHPHCLHLWRPTGKDIPLPDSILVGPKDESATRKA